MNLLITPMLVGLLVSSSPNAGECLSESAVRPCENCAIKVSAHAASDHLERQARKHTGYYLTLLRARQDAGSAPANALRQYSARIAPDTAQ